ncbi:UvrD-helicase domain-containing protein [Alphaproteobacteria bacterium]|nr:UvrD-helicase domain-containing protein [Alphaproteobacteria bacterium]MDC0131363.1 UvrD-helicase domain-containing protein [Alphaproteobacteria bacterium]MDC0147823.1 UvrD-helicase domain-containing protein [Alphaproteobacteria bacterium]
MENDPFDLASDDAPVSAPIAPNSTQAEGLSISERARQAAHANRTEPLLEGLNEEQRAAVLADDGPLLLLAGAGTGKTRALTTRIAYKIATQQAWPSQVLAVTFTNKAAREMKERIGSMLGETVEGMPWLGTFHSLSARILRQHAELVGLRPDFTILDMDDTLRLLKQLIKAENIDEKRWPARQMSSLIDGWKNRGWMPEDVPAGEAGFFGNGLGGKIYADYQRRLKVLNAVDFGDLLLESLRLLRENEEVLRDYQQRFQHILVDEYQDTNVVQYLWLRLLAQAHNNICCVGDDDQSIYGWRGAEVDNILRFEKDFEGAQVIRLERNYRSTPHILGAASGLIAANEGRLGKTLWTDRTDGDKLLVRGVWDGEEEARATADDIEANQRSGQKLNDMAVLVRASFQMREFEDRFISLGVPYRVIGGPRFYERAEIRDANAYFRLIAQIDDDLAFERICNKPRRGLGNVALQILHDAARRQSTSLFRAAELLIDTEELKPAARRALSGFIMAMRRWRELVPSMTHTELAELVLDESGYTAMWQADKSPDAPGKLDNLKELVRSMDEFETLTGYLEHISLVMEAQNSDDDDKVSIMTLHAAKGLEFNNVFLPGWEEGLFPHQRSLDESGKKGLEEERRLAYVGITRAKRKATISFAGNRRTHGQWMSALPSRFIDELPNEHVDVAESSHEAGGFSNQSRFANDFNSSSYSSPGWQRAQNNKARYESRQPPRANNREPVAASMNSSAHKRGERIFHQKFGYGRIDVIDGNKLTVSFEKAGIKKVLDSYVEKP